MFPVNPPLYAILSHTWEADDQEVRLKDIEDRVGTHKTGYKKVEFCARQGQNHHLEYFWVNSCYIDQSSSAELSTVINSMYHWYQNSGKCYVYIADISTSSSSESESSFLRSRWFTRGWTLQELVAPTSIEFFSEDGMYLGDKTQLKDPIQEITGISNQILQGHPPTQDIVHSVLGIFGIHMPPIYSKRAIHTFQRLRQEIKKSNRKGPTMPKRVTYNVTILCCRKWI
ncbi:HET-domain-containing protein [Amniculicola lignicola CBS 123094]|uniref:HET-domain-containing protein n=1 Tax=Amniculicola lignicola CBS 123094 TaxID=1392246 RepID=A0A6A5W588_9PLEO|nr:HET-domain-containing protein [Amniculicola lignicola CBS 123094]